MTEEKSGNKQPFWRLAFVFMVVAGLFGVTVWKVLDLQVIDNEFLQLQGDARTVRNDVINANRGNIMDRNGEPLAISTPVQSLWLNPREVLQQPEQWAVLAPALEAIGVNPEVLRNRVAENAGREFLYIKRRLSPSEARGVLSLGLKGVYALEEYKRYYPLGEVAAHIVGLTNADDVGQEGLELAYEDWLKGQPGSRQVLKDRLGGIIREVRINEVAQQGNDLHLSIDSRIQYLAYKALKEEVTKRRAAAGTAVVLDARSGEVLAMVSQPSYNPNNRASLDGSELRNRAMTDLIEPGSTVKSFTIAAALESGLFDTASVIDTSPGYTMVDSYTIKDPVDYGKLTLERVITKSSQVGATRIGLTIGEQPMLDMLSRVGFGNNIGTGFPGEASGVLPNHRRWSKADIATLAYGYGFHVTTLQLAQAYMVLANGGIRKPVSLLEVEGVPEGRRVIEESVVRQVVPMLETVVDKAEGGTGVLANIPSYRVAGKTGTARYYNVGQGGYQDDNHVSVFAGFVPVSDPRIVAVITVHEAQGEEYGGGQVAAPVFAKIAGGAMRILNVPPDLPGETARVLTLGPAGASPAREPAMPESRLATAASGGSRP